MNLAIAGEDEGGDDDPVGVELEVAVAHCHEASRAEVVGRGVVVGSGG